MMVSHILGTEELDKNLEEFILEKTEGVPFFIEELIKSLKDLKVIARENGKYCVKQDIKEVTIPVTIQDVIMARVDSLPQEMKSLLQTASVVGRESRYDLIKRVTGLTEEELLPQLSLLKDSELLYERAIYPQSTYIFKHALTQEVAYTLSITSRACSSLGRWAEAAKIGKKALSVAEEYSDNSLITFASWNISINYGWEFDIVQAIEYGEMALEKAQTHGDILAYITSLRPNFADFFRYR
jgi:tetratricopeptide (TPR) repeat protein